MRKVLTTVFTGAVMASGAIAEDGLDIYGFASFATGKTVNEQNLPDGSESTFGPSDREIYNDQVQYRPETTIGLQIDADLDDGLMLKTLLQADGEKNYAGEMKWAYAKYELVDSFDIAIGRQPLPLFYYTDFIDVGYSYQWVRAPLETYYIKNSTFDGAQLKWTPTVGNFEYRFQMYHGRDEENSELTLTLNDITGLVAYMRKDWFEARATWMQAKIETGLQGFDVQTGGLVDLGEIETETTYYGAALKATFEASYLTAEWVSDKENDPIQEFAYLEGTEAWYVSAGFGVKNFVPYVTYAESINNFSKDSPLLLGDSHVRSNSWTGGVRWDFHSNAALKFEYTSRKDKSSDGIVALAGSVKEVDALSASIDLVF
jgi:hypothetical protein